MNCLRVAANNFKRSYNRRTSFLVNLAIPIIVVVLGIFANSVSKPGFTIGVIHENMSVNIVEALSDTDGITVARANPETVKIDLITGKFAAIVDFSEAEFKLYSIKDERTNKKLEQIIDSYKVSSEPVTIGKVMGVPMSAAERTIAFITLFLMITATVTASLMIKDKSSGTLKRYKYSPQRPANYILGNYIYNYLITFFQYLLSIVFMQLLGVDIGIGFLDLFLMGIWLSGIATAFGTFVSSIFQKEMYASLFAAFIALILSLVGGTFIAYENMPIMLRKISVISPLRWFVEITKSMENGMSWFGNVQQVTALSGMILFLILISTFIHKGTKAI